MNLDCDNCGPSYTEFTAKWDFSTNHMMTLARGLPVVSSQFTSPQGHIWEIEARKNTNTSMTIDPNEDFAWLPMIEHGDRWARNARKDLSLKATLVKMANCTSAGSLRAAVKYRFSMEPTQAYDLPEMIIKHPKRITQGDFVETLWSYERFYRAKERYRESFIVLTVLMDDPISETDLVLRSHASQKLKAFPELLKTVLNDPQFADAKIKVGTESFPVHRCILAGRSKVFSSMFTSGMQESRNHELEINDFEPDIVKAMIDYIYTGDVANAQETYFELLEIADKYELLELKDVCEKIMIQNLTVCNAGRALQCAYERNLKVMPEVVEFVNKNRKEVTKTEIFKTTCKHHPDLLLELYVASANDDENSPSSSQGKRRKY